MVVEAKNDSNHADEAHHEVHAAGGLVEQREGVMTIAILPNETGNPAGKLAEAELRFGPEDGLLNGLKLIGFGIWERRNGIGRNVTFPARQYSVGGERRSYALLRPILDLEGQQRVWDAILEAYDAQTGAA